MGVKRGLKPACSVPQVRLVSYGPNQGNGTVMAMPCCPLDLGAFSFVDQGTKGQSSGCATIPNVLLVTQAGHDTAPAPGEWGDSPPLQGHLRVPEVLSAVGAGDIVLTALIVTAVILPHHNPVPELVRS